VNNLKGRYNMYAKSRLIIVTYWDSSPPIPGSADVLGLHFDVTVSGPIQTSDEPYIAHLLSSDILSSPYPQPMGDPRAFSHIQRSPYSSLQEEQPLVLRPAQGKVVGKSEPVPQVEAVPD
jgi:hypothetical protein